MLLIPILCRLYHTGDSQSPPAKWSTAFHFLGSVRVTGTSSEARLDILAHQLHERERRPDTFCGFFFVRDARDTIVIFTERKILDIDDVAS